MGSSDHTLLTPGTQGQRGAGTWPGALGSKDGQPVPTGTPIWAVPVSMLTPSLLRTGRETLPRPSWPYLPDQRAPAPHVPAPSPVSSQPPVLHPRLTAHAPQVSFPRSLVSTLHSPSASSGLSHLPPPSILQSSALLPCPGEATLLPTTPPASYVTKALLAPPRSWHPHASPLCCST